MAVRKASDSNIAGKKYNDASAGASKITDVPDAGTIGTATDVGTSRAINNGAATVAATVPSTGGVPASYTATSNPGSLTGTGNTLPVTVTGLSSGTAYTFTVSATTTAGTTTYTGTSNSITATTVASAPTIGTVSSPSAGSTSVSVPFTASSNNGGKTITSYEALSSPGSLTGTGNTSPITVSGLSLGTAYTFQVRAVNGNGNSAYSSASNSVTPNYPTSLTDNFNRSGNLGGSTASDGVNVWSNVRGTWSVNGSQASNSDAASNNSIAIVNLAGTNTTTARVDTPAGGVGVAFWVQSSSNWWAAYPFYAQTTSTACNSNSGSFSNPPPNCCGSVTSGYSVEAYCPWGYAGEYFSNNCSLSQSFLDAICGGGGTYGGCQSYYICPSNSTVTNYSSRVRVANQAGVQRDTEYNTNTSSYSTAGSVFVSTSGDVVTYRAYSSTGGGGSTLLNTNFTPSSPVKGTGFGVFKGPSEQSQGSVVDNILVQRA